MATYSNIDALQCRKLQDAANLALADATEAMGIGTMNSYGKRSASATRQCICRLKSVTVKIITTQIEVEGANFEPIKVFSKDDVRFEVIPSRGKCAEGKNF